MSAKVNNSIDSRITIDLQDKDNTQILLNSRRHRQEGAQLYSPLRFWTATKREDLFAVKDNDITIGQIFTSWFIDDRHPDISHPIGDDFNVTDPNFPREYLIFGYWLHADKNNLDQANVGTFSIGTELKDAGPIQASGKATYRGIAGGILTYDVDAPKHPLFPGSFVEAGDFSADITLQADFDENSISGCIGCTRGIGLKTITNRERVPEELQTEFAVNQTGHYILLQDAKIQNDGSFTGEIDARYWNTGHPYYVVESSGKWGGVPSGAKHQNGQPKVLAGTFSGNWKDNPVNPEYFLPQGAPPPPPRGAPRGGSIVWCLDGNLTVCRK